MEAAWSLDAVNHEGWRVNIDEGGGKRGWALLRQSLHDPLLVRSKQTCKLVCMGPRMRVHGHLAGRC